MPLSAAPPTPPSVSPRSPRVTGILCSFSLPQIIDESQKLSHKAMEDYLHLPLRLPLLASFRKETKQKRQDTLRESCSSHGFLALGFHTAVFEFHGNTKYFTVSVWYCL